MPVTILRRGGGVTYSSSSVYSLPALSYLPCTCLCSPTLPFFMHPRAVCKRHSYRYANAVLRVPLPASGSVISAIVSLCCSSCWRHSATSCGIACLRHWQRRRMERFWWRRAALLLLRRWHALLLVLLAVACPLRSPFVVHTTRRGCACAAACWLSVLRWRFRVHLPSYSRDDVAFMVLYCAGSLSWPRAGTTADTKRCAADICSNCGVRSEAAGSLGVQQALVCGLNRIYLVVLFFTVGLR